MRKNIECYIHFICLFFIIMLYKLLFYLNPVWYTFSFHGYAKRATICSPLFLPAGGACPQTEGPVGKRTSRYVHYSLSHLFNTLYSSPSVIFFAAAFILLGLYLISSLSYLGSCQHLLLATMFALNFCYQPVDLVLVTECGILEILSMLTNNSCALMNQGWYAAATSGSMLLSGAVRLACARLLQILTVASR